MNYLTMQTLDSEPQLFSDIWPLTLSDGDADHHLEAGSGSVEGRRIVNISYLASHIIDRKQLNVLVVEKVASASIVSKTTRYISLCRVVKLNIYGRESLVKLKMAQDYDCAPHYSGAHLLVRSPLVRRPISPKAH